MLKPSQQTVNVISFSSDDSGLYLVTEMHKFRISMMLSMT